MKYIMLRVLNQAGKELEVPIIFPEIFNHCDVAKALQYIPAVSDDLIMHDMMIDTPISAGFCEIGVVHCNGRSESLRTDSREMDSLLVTFNSSLGNMSEDDLVNLPPTVLEKLHNKMGWTK